MKWSELLTSSVGKKFVMGLTGIFLILFLIVHVCLNATIWANDSGRMFNIAADFMGTTVVMRVLEIGLFIGFILHIVQAYVLELQNAKRRNVGYKVPMGGRGSRWYTRYMGWLGTFILLFLVIHIKNFWIPSRFNMPAEYAQTYHPGVEVHDLYRLMQDTFSNGWFVIIYLIGCLSLAFHLYHGFQSAFRSLGVYNGRYLRLINGIGKCFAVVVPLAFAMMPVSMYFNWV